MYTLTILVYGHPVVFDSVTDAERTDLQTKLEAQSLGMGSHIQFRNWSIVALHINGWAWSEVIDTPAQASS
jgi:hypothetical protein